MNIKTKRPVRANPGAWMVKELEAAGYPVVDYDEATSNQIAWVILYDSSNRRMQPGVMLTIQYDRYNDLPISIIAQKYTTRGREGKCIRFSSVSESEFLDLNFRWQIARMLEDMKVKTTNPLFDSDLQGLLEERASLYEDLDRIEKSILRRKEELGVV